MITWTPYLLVYLAGIATPIFLFRQLLRSRSDDGACLMEALLLLLGVLFVAVIAFSVMNG